MPQIEPPDRLEDVLRKHYTAAELKQHALIDDFTSGHIDLDTATNSIRALGFVVSDEMRAQLESYKSRFLR